jgi:hypothetical protein
MKALQCVLSLILALPCTGLAAAFLVFGDGIVTNSPSSYFGVILDTGAWLLPWGLLASFVAFVALIAAGLIARFRRGASVCVTALAILSSIPVLIVTAVNFSPERLLVLALALSSACVASWPHPNASAFKRSE